MTDAPIDPTLNEHHCFGCGRHNPIGLHLTFERDGDDVLTRYAPREEDQGFPDLMHGGILGLILDEAMGWAMYADRVFAVTAKMETRYRKPAGLDATLTARARITRQRGRRIEVEATITDEVGDCVAESSGLFLRMDPEAEAQALSSFRASGGEWPEDG